MRIAASPAIGASVMALVVIVCAGACTDRSESAPSSGLTLASTSTSTSTSVAPGASVVDSLPPRPAGSPWKRVFSDEFDGDTLDVTRWATCYYWSATTCTNASTNELELYTPKNVSVASGLLQLTARREVAVEGGRTFPFTSGMVSGATPDRTLFAFRYGYVEARARIPAGVGLWSAFWLLPARRAALPEVDVFENVGYQPDVVLQFTHWLTANGPQQFGNASAVRASGGGWHVYGLDWEPKSLTWYVDGRKVWVMDSLPAVPQEDMTLVADLAVGGPYATAPNAKTPFPATLSFSHVRVWQHP